MILKTLKPGPQLLAAAVTGIIITTALIYTTPLKHFNWIQPKIDDIEPRKFNNEFLANPEKYLFIDVRSPTEFFREHAEGSINIPINVLYFEKDSLPKTGKTIVLICTGGALSGVAYHYLEHHGFFNLKRIEGGIRAWDLEGLPVLKDSWK